MLVVLTGFLYAPVRFFLDFLRPEDTDPRYWDLTFAQWSSILAFAAAGYVATKIARTGAVAKVIAPTSGEAQEQLKVILREADDEDGADKGDAPKASSKSKSGSGGGGQEERCRRREEGEGRSRADGSAKDDVKKDAPKKDKAPPVEDEVAKGEAAQGRRSCRGCAKPGARRSTRRARSAEAEKAKADAKADDVEAGRKVPPTLGPDD